MTCWTARIWMVR
jgi:hypothetical protein